MKRLQNSIFALLAILLSFSFAVGQTATSGCTSVTVTNSGAAYPTNAYFASVGYSTCTSGGCCRVISSGSAATPRYQLQVLSGASWVTSGAQQASPTFTGLTTHGTYRVVITVPEYNTVLCSGNLTTCYNTLGQLIGYWGQWSNVVRFTNAVVVGSSVVSDLAYTFVDGGGGNSLPDGFDVGETVTINTTGTKNYESWWIAIFENGGALRYRSMGWTSGFGSLPTSINLSTFWNGGAGWAFTSLNSYTVQFAITTSCNTSWANLDKTFFICPGGSGCRPAGNVEAISISPNPANGSIQLHHYEAVPGAQFKMLVIDMNGRTVKNFNDYSAGDYDVSDLGCGMYTVAVWDGNSRVHTSKLSIAR